MHYETVKALQGLENKTCQFRIEELHDMIREDFGSQKRFIPMSNQAQVALEECGEGTESVQDLVAMINNNGGGSDDLVSE